MEKRNTTKITCPALADATRDEYRVWRSVFIVIALAYIVLLVKLVLFKDVPELLEGARPNRSFNLIPFYTIQEFFRGQMKQGLVNELGNLLLFVPMGILLSLFFRRQSIWKTILACFVVSLSFELLQYTFYLGVADVDDIILNVIGGALGYGLIRLFSLIPNCKRRLSLLAVFLVCMGIALVIVLYYIDRSWLEV